MKPDYAQSLERPIEQAGFIYKRGLGTYRQEWSIVLQDHYTTNSREQVVAVPLEVGALCRLRGRGVLRSKAAG